MQTTKSNADFPCRINFREYYKTQGIVEAEEWEAFEQKLDEPLAITFRISAVDENVSKSLETQLETKFQPEFRDSMKLSLSRVTWYASNKCWQLSCSRPDLRKLARKNKLCRGFHDFLVQQSGTGNITRQELVSMLPPLALDVHASHMVLDLCASPGSKTSQILEILDKENSGIPLSERGMVIANDKDKQRAYMLAHQCNRIGSTSLVVTCHEGQWFPDMPPPERSTGTEAGSFDRILCDVPCSGDGTIRKAPAVLKDWHSGNGVSLHLTQVSLALRAATLLKVNGLFVYSTCSLNPIENEAVIAEVLRRTNGSLQVIEARDGFPSALRVRKGNVKWKVCFQKKDGKKKKKKKVTANELETKAQGLEWFETFDDVPQNLKNDRFYPSMFSLSDEELKDSKFVQNVERSMRFLPHDNDTGGFFIAVFKKLSEFSIESTKVDCPEKKEFVSFEGYKCHICGANDHWIQRCPKKLNSKQEKTTEAVLKDPSRKTYACSIQNCGRTFLDGPSLNKHMQSHDRKNLFCSATHDILQGQNQSQSQIAQNVNLNQDIKDRDEEFAPFSPISTPDWNSLLNYYDLSADFPHNQLLTRSNASMNVYLVSKRLADIYSHHQHNLNVINLGVKAFVRDNVKHTFHRIPQASLSLILPHIQSNRRYVRIDKSELRQAAELFASLDQKKQHCTITELFPQSLAAIESKGKGSVLLGLADQCREAHPFVLSFFIGEKNISPLFTSDQAEYLLTLL